MINQNKLSHSTITRVNELLSIFSKESKDIRELLVSYLPAQNLLQSCHAKSFEEFALLPLAREQGEGYKKDVLYDYKKLRPPCVKCGEKERIQRRGENNYFCRACGKVYTANHDSIVSGMKYSSLVWMQVLLCMLRFYSIKETCDLCRITPTTYYKMRNRLFYAMQVMMEEVKMYGTIQVDNTFVHVNFKGTNLNGNDDMEDSPFSFNNFIPRPARTRGGHYKQKEKNLNNICIFTAIDDYGHVMVRYTGIGATSSARLSKKLDATKFLKHVPKEDPFLYSVLKENGNKRTVSDAGKETLVVSDKEKAIIRYMNKLGLKLEYHVYRRNGVQQRLAGHDHDIQRVNHLHKKLKEFLRNTNHVSTKYLPGFLMLFEFSENTNASDEAIGYLFEILARPGLGKSPNYYKTLFQTPNYVLEFCQEDNPLAKFPDEQLYTAYLYEMFKTGQEVNGSFISVKEITEITNYSPSSVRRIYKNFSSSGLIPLIVKYFQINDKKAHKTQKSKVEKNDKFTPEMLSVYDEYCAFRTLPRNKRQTTQQFFVDMNKKYNMNYSFTSWKRICRNVSKSGIRKPLPPLTPVEYDYSEILEEYNKIIKSYLSENMPLPKNEFILNQMSEKIRLAPVTINRYLTKARRCNRNMIMQMETNTEEVFENTAGN